MINSPNREGEGETEDVKLPQTLLLPGGFEAVLYYQDGRKSSAVRIPIRIIIVSAPDEHQGSIGKVFSQMHQLAKEPPLKRSKLNWKKAVFKVQKKVTLEEARNFLMNPPQEEMKEARATHDMLYSIDKKKFSALCKDGWRLSEKELTAFKKLWEPYLDRAFSSSIKNQPITIDDDAKVPGSHPGSRVRRSSVGVNENGFKCNVVGCDVETEDALMFQCGNPDCGEPERWFHAVCLGLEDELKSKGITDETPVGDRNLLMFAEEVRCSHCNDPRKKKPGKVKLNKKGGEKDEKGKKKGGSYEDKVNKPKHQQQPVVQTTTKKNKRKHIVNGNSDEEKEDLEAIPKKNKKNKKNKKEIDEDEEEIDKGRPKKQKHNKKNKNPKENEKIIKGKERNEDVEIITEDVEEGEFPIEKIAKKRKNKEGILEALVVWKDGAEGGENSSTWEPIDHLEGVESDIENATWATDEEREDNEGHPPVSVPPPSTTAKRKTDEIDEKKNCNSNNN